MRRAGDGWNRLGGKCVWAREKIVWTVRVLELVLVLWKG